MTQPIDLFLRAGQTARLYVGRNAVFHLLHGELNLATGPHWLAETMFGEPVPLRPGQVHGLVDAGWATLTAPVSAHLRCIGLCQVPARAGVLSGWRARLVGGWRALRGFTGVLRPRRA
ncbi:hypothetical protein [Chitiniphilus eburneus]|uniref:Uncharacterized protein n=1 Tax=Chitiniphilus eburneus TaxID=2571148 RepID=A0A4U0PWP9_9NEIS|nr:hypothetical protein [Chitiniphilus eburneus]TJZ72986.1 hypothetical protein FAZ21_12270 [Chitiniphilus eburneus]